MSPIHQPRDHNCQSQSPGDPPGGIEGMKRGPAKAISLFEVKAALFCNSSRIFAGIINAPLQEGK